MFVVIQTHRIPRAASASEVSEVSLSEEYWLSFKDVGGDFFVPR
jgi:hypothetical protein